jgi:hypothetical protein
MKNSDAIVCSKDFEFTQNESPQLVTSCSTSFSHAHAWRWATLKLLPPAMSAAARSSLVWVILLSLPAASTRVRRGLQLRLLRMCSVRVIEPARWIAVSLLDYSPRCSGWIDAEWK